MTPTDPIAVIQRTVAGHYGLSVSEMLYGRRTDRNVWPRSEAVYIASLLTPHFLWTRIYEAFHRDYDRQYDFVPHAVKRVKDRRKIDRYYRWRLDRLAAEVSAALNAPLEPAQDRAQAAR